MKLDLHTLCLEHAIVPRGIIHVGSSEGQELKRYPVSETANILVIEANPDAVQRLQAQFDTNPNIQVVHSAITNHNDTVTLYIPAIESSSSILPFTGYQDIYPNLKKIHKITVGSRTLDALLAECQLEPKNFNLLYLDIHGAELLALQGARELLPSLQGIYTIVSHQDLFKGGALLEQVDDFLEQYNFCRVAQANPYHPAWGEVFYVRQIGKTVQAVQAIQVKQLQEELEQVRVQLVHSQAETEKLETELAHSQTETEKLETELAHSQTETEKLETRHQQVQDQLKTLEAQSQKSRVERDQARSELRQTREELELTQFQLDEIQVELEQAQSQLHQAKIALEQANLQLQSCQSTPSNNEHVKTLARILAEILETTY